MTSAMHKITDFKFQHGYKVMLHFEDGYSGTVDLEPLLKKGIAQALLDTSAFESLYIEDGGGLAWSNGFDLCPNQLRMLAEATEAMNAAS